ncbi:MAG: hypothetical protein FRX49_08994 [Trebouxia sp. A1-2]|nr:MAG: hypothetical protein FRX49_08994 [Trebouxia sp. A1-2]
MHCHIFGVVYLVVFAKLICLRSHAAQAARQDLDSSMSHQAAARQEEVRVPRALAKDTWTATHDGVQQSLNANQQSLQPSGALVSPRNQESSSLMKDFDSGVKNLG